MPFRKFEKNKIELCYKDFCDNDSITRVNLSDLELELRKYMLEAHEQYKELIQEDKYKYDLIIGLKLFEFIENNRTELEPVIECNYNFWRFLSTVVFPEITRDRWGIDNKNHFFEGAGHVYANQIYWYIKLSWQGSYKTTYDVLENNTTDEILNLVDRTGKIGVNIELYRYLMKKYSEFPKDKRTVVKNTCKKISLFRAICIKNLLKQTVIVPEIYKGGVFGYVDMLFEEYNYLKE